MEGEQGVQTVPSHLPGRDPDVMVGRDPEATCWKGCHNTVEISALATKGCTPVLADNIDTFY